MAGMVTDDLNKFGPFGRYNGVTTVSSGTFDFSSGSGLGAAAFILSGSAGASGQLMDINDPKQEGSWIELSRGGKLMITSMSVGKVYEIGISRAYSNSVKTHICVLRR
jgi:hypothetical protein|tara:strand:- start:5145 stop:5468 length:324 start_codon:yes stop_codon:yes gene_type:complete